MTNYWHKVLNRRLTRRRALAATGATAGAAAFLAACGGDDGGSGTSGDSSGLLAGTTDETKSVKRGGSFTAIQVTPVTLDPHLSGGQVAHSWHAYSQLFRLKEGYMEPSSGDFEGELAESYEFSADRLTLTVKLKPGVLFAPQGAS
jgi:peptide/nickel transport system substrate-binding protein